MTIIDSHSHIYLEEFDGDREAIMQRAEKEGVAKILMPAIDMASHEMMFRIESAFPGRCLSMMGLHPCSVKENYLLELNAVETLLETRPSVAVGEIGLDFYWDLTFKDQQFEAFKRQLELAKQYQLPVSIHSRNATGECIETVRALQDGKLTGVFHCFSGTLEQAKEIIDLGLYLGIGGVITFKNSGLDKVMDSVSLDHVVLETDAPYLAPVPFRGKRNEPAYLKYVIDKLADIKKISPADVAAITTANGEKVFNKMNTLIHPSQ